MKKINAHSFSWPNPRQYLQEEIDDLDFLTNTALANNPANAHSVYRQASRTAALAAYLGEEQERVFRLLDLALDGAVTTFMLAMKDDGYIEVTIAGIPVRYNATGPSDGANSHILLEAICLSLILGRKDSLKILESVNIDTLRHSPTYVDEYRNLLIPAFIAVIHGEDASGLLESVRIKMISDKANSDFDVLLKAFVDALDNLSAGESIGYCDALAKMLMAHQNYWSSEQWKNDPSGFMSFLAAGLAVLADIRGISCEISSAYMPDWLVHVE